MTSMQERLQGIKEMLVAITPDTYHYFREVRKSRYIIWAEDTEEGSFHADNKKQRQGIHGTIDLFTKQEYDPMVDRIQEGLEGLEKCAWSLNSVQYEDETNMIHYEWDFELR